MALPDRLFKFYPLVFNNIFELLPVLINNLIQLTFKFPDVLDQIINFHVSYPCSAIPLVNHPHGLAQ